MVRLLHAALSAVGITTYSRITGAVPRRMGPRGTDVILRSSGGHVEEMRWWLRSLPPDAEAVVMEHSAFTPELQPLAARWLRPETVVLTNVLPDHPEAWGTTAHHAAAALLMGIPEGVVVVAPEEVLRMPLVSATLGRTRCEVVAVSSAPQAGFKDTHRALALGACSRLNLDPAVCERAMEKLGPDIADFRVMKVAEARCAVAFSANDIQSTKALFDTLDWRRRDTTVIYNHRKDRPGRLKTFEAWLASGLWRGSVIIGDRPFRHPARWRYEPVKSAGALARIIQREGKVFGCGNLAGPPLELLLNLRNRSAGSDL